MATHTRWVDFRVKTFVAEARQRIGTVLEPLGFTGPEVKQDDGIGPLSMSVCYHRSDVSVRTKLSFWYGGEDRVTTSLVRRGMESDGGRRVEVGSNTAHTGYQMRRALDLQAQALADLLSSADGDGSP